MGLTVLPIRVDGELGRVKADFPGSPTPVLASQVPAAEWNVLARAVEELAAAVGLADGSTYGSLVRAARSDYTLDPSQPADPTRSRFRTFGEILERHVDHDLVSRVWLAADVVNDVHDTIDMDRFEIRGIISGRRFEVDSTLTSFGSTLPRILDCYFRNVGTSGEVARLTTHRSLVLESNGALWQVNDGGRVITVAGSAFLSLRVRGTSATLGGQNRPVVYMEDSAGASAYLFDQAGILSKYDFQGPGTNGVYMYQGPNARAVNYVAQPLATGTQHYIEGHARPLVFAGTITYDGNAQQAWLNLGPIDTPMSAARVGVPLHGSRTLLRLTVWAPGAITNLGPPTFNAVVECDDHDYNGGGGGAPRDEITVPVSTVNLMTSSPRSSAAPEYLGDDILHLIGVRVDIAAGGVPGQKLALYATLEVL